MRYRSPSNRFAGVLTILVGLVVAAVGFADRPPIWVTVIWLLGGSLVMWVGFRSMHMEVRADRDALWVTNLRRSFSVPKDEISSFEAGYSMNGQIIKLRLADGRLMKLEGLGYPAASTRIDRVAGELNAWLHDPLSPESS